MSLLYLDPVMNVPRQDLSVSVTVKKKKNQRQATPVPPLRGIAALAE